VKVLRHRCPCDRRRWTLAASRDRGRRCRSRSLDELSTTEARGGGGRYIAGPWWDVCVRPCSRGRSRGVHPPQRPRWRGLVLLVQPREVEPELVLEQLEAGDTRGSDVDVCRRCLEASSRCRGTAPRAQVAQASAAGRARLNAMEDGVLACVGQLALADRASWRAASSKSPRGHERYSAASR